MLNRKTSLDGSISYYDEDGNIILSVKDYPIIDYETHEIIGYETVSVDQD
jgi:hypothetical protein